MTITTAGTVAHLSPIVVKTFFKHYYDKARKASEDQNTEATDEFLYDEAFHVVKAFLQSATCDTVQAIQNFTNTHVPSPPWATCKQALIPLHSCGRAADVLKDYFGPEDLKTLVGGEKWWQIRGLAGVQAEWIAQKSDWKEVRRLEKAKESLASRKGSFRMKRNARHERKGYRPATSKRGLDPSSLGAEEVRSEENGGNVGGESEDDPGGMEELDRLKRVMLYIHGGGYYFGSLSTHRYQIIRFSRKFGGRCFAPLYRKAPQYPWPCALQDVLASYFYLIDPPSGAGHKPVDPSQIVISGDSAGGGLALALLTVLRDMKLPMPAGAVLISPWCDMTHSFPSIMANTETDIIPPYGFIHKPSTLWPVANVAPERRKGDRASSADDKKGPEIEEPGLAVPVGAGDLNVGGKHGNAGIKGGTSPNSANTVTGIPKAQTDPATSSKKRGIPPPPNPLFSDPIEVNRSDPSKEPIQLASQIQLYATNAQLTHPLCSPILHGSLGGLPPLYIIAGDSEVLRDEIIYLAHRAANPERYPLSKELLQKSDRARRNAAEYNSQPTKVHLQIYDDMCHVLTLFAFTSQARFAYRAVASFVKHVTGAKTNLINPFPRVAEGGEGPEDGSDDSDIEVASPSATKVPSRETSNLGLSSVSGSLLDTSISENSASTSQIRPTSNISTGQLSDPHTKTRPRVITDQVLIAEKDVTDSPHQISRNGSSSLLIVPSATPQAKSDATGISETSGTGSQRSSFLGRIRSNSRDKESTDLSEQSSAGHDRKKALQREERRHALSLGVSNDYTGLVPLMRPSFHSSMIRERVDVRGFLRPLEPESELQALQISPDEIGVIKEGPCHRYLVGQEKWSKKYAKAAKKVEKKRAKNEERARRILEKALSDGLLDPDAAKGLATNAGHKQDEGWVDLAVFGPTDIGNETPPPSAIAGRRDTGDAITLLRTSLQVRSADYGGGKREEADDATGSPKQSAAEKQIEGRSQHGMRFWNYLG
ncbi:alpha/beta-hydrolase [Violaceomyces palustris]|uniref:Alpha/beta-hydrolase n=1 Tax=Violaceomyces palustris TaxID=1673888 RepID=A0ACD0NSI0_9BASI|nr:alpha/beta-hydrolase [Violaceomyces palustris]